MGAWQAADRTFGWPVPNIYPERSEGPCWVRPPSKDAVRRRARSRARRLTTSYGLMPASSSGLEYPIRNRGPALGVTRRGPLLETAVRPAQKCSAWSVEAQSTTPSSRKLS